MNQEILRRCPRNILELWVRSIWARLDHGKSWFKQEVCRKKCENFDENLKFWRFFRNDPRSTLNRPKTKKTAFSYTIQWFLDKMVRSTLLHLPHCGAFGWFWHPRASAWFWPFDPILLIDILHRSINPQKYFENYVWALIWLNISSNGPREDMSRRGNASQKMWKNWWKIEFWRIFINRPRSTQKHSKIKKTAF